MKYINKVDEAMIKDFFEKYLSHKNLNFCRMQKQAFNILVRYCYESNFCKQHNMTFHDYHVTSNNSIWVAKLWRAFMYKKFGEQYLIDYKNDSIDNFKDCFKRYKNSEKYKLAYEELDKKISKQIVEIKKIAEKKELTK